MTLIRNIAADSNSPRVLRTSGQPDCATVFHGPFWPLNVNLGKCFWEAWVKPTSNGYLVSDGYGGGHAILWGWNSLPGPVNGNMYTGAGLTSFQGTYVIAVGEWVHLALAWNGSYIFTYVNGIPDSKTIFAGPRQSGDQGAGSLYVCGSEHQNGGMDLALIRCWDRLADLFIATGDSFVPERFPSRYDPISQIPCDFFCEYGEGSPGQFIDTSPRGVSSNAALEIQTVTFTGGPTAGSALITLPGGSGAQTMESVAFDESGASFQTKLLALSRIGADGAVVVRTGVGSAGDPYLYTITFRHRLGNLPQLISTHTFTGGTSPTVTHATLSDGGGDDRQHHSGRLLVNKSILGGVLSSWQQSFAPRPPKLADATCPYGQDYDSPLPDENIPAPGAVPPGALIFDSFGRRNVTQAFQHHLENPITPGDTEGGSLGIKTWQQGIIGNTSNSPLWAILQGKLVPIVPSGVGPVVAWVDGETANCEVRATRTLNGNLDRSLGIAFRLVDKDNLWRAYFSDEGNGITVGYYEDAAFTEVASIGVIPNLNTFAQMSAWMVDDVIRIYTDDGSGNFSQVGSDIISEKFMDAENHGFVTGPFDSSSLVRYDDFTILPASAAFVGGNLTVVGTGETTVDLSWTRSFFGQNPITEQLQRKLTSEGAGSWVNVVGATASPFQDTGLTSGVSYDYRVKYTDNAAAVVFSDTEDALTDVPFTPDDLGAKLIFWGEARFESYANDDPVPTFNDQHGAETDYAATDVVFKTNQINGHPALRFNGVSSFMDANYGASIPQPRTVFLVLKPIQLFGGTIMDSASGSRQILVITFDGASRWMYYSGNGPFAGNLIVTADYVIIVIRYSGATFKAWINGVLDLAVDIGSANMGVGPRVGCNISSGGFQEMYLPVLIDTVNLTDAETNQVAGYLAKPENYDLPWQDI